MQSSTVADVKVVIRNAAGIALEEQRLICGTREFPNNWEGVDVATTSLTLLRYTPEQVEWRSRLWNHPLGWHRSPEHRLEFTEQAVFFERVRTTQQVQSGSRQPSWNPVSDI